jgi:hypothetical protein
MPGQWEEISMSGFLENSIPGRVASDSLDHQLNVQLETLPPLD